MQLLSPSGQVTFFPDFARFGMRELEEDNSLRLLSVSWARRQEDLLETSGSLLVRRKPHSTLSSGCQ